MGFKVQSGPFDHDQVIRKARVYDNTYTHAHTSRHGYIKAVEAFSFIFPSALSLYLLQIPMLSLFSLLLPLLSILLGPLSVLSLILFHDFLPKSLILLLLFFRFFKPTVPKTWTYAPRYANKKEQRHYLWWFASRIRLGCSLLRWFTVIGLLKLDCDSGLIDGRWFARQCRYCCHVFLLIRLVVVVVVYVGLDRQRCARVVPLWCRIASDAVTVCDDDDWYCWMGGTVLS